MVTLQHLVDQATLNRKGVSIVPNTFRTDTFSSNDCKKSVLRFAVVQEGSLVSLPLPPKNRFGPGHNWKYMKVISTKTVQYIDDTLSTR
jgi:hypothetical protein